MSKVLVTGMSGTGKSTVLQELGKRGHRVVDTDTAKWSHWVRLPDGSTDWVWREDAMSALLAGHRNGHLFVAGCKSNQGRFYPSFDHIALLSAPADVILGRIASRTTNPFGKHPDERVAILRDLADVEPLLRATATVEIDASTTISEIVRQLEALAANAGGSVAAIHRAGSEPISVWDGREHSHRADLDAGSILYVGSIAKQFVAACIALLEIDVALDLEDPVSRFVPRLPSWGQRVTIRHLVHHTGGVKERSREGPGVLVDGVPAWGNAEMLDALRRVTGLDFEPGTRYGYSNRGYLLLAEVIAAASGAGLAGLARERIFEPLGMHDTFFRDEETPLPERAARGHFEADDGNVYIEPARFHAVGAGGLWTTVADLATWSANFDDDRLTDGWLPARLTTRGVLDDGTPIHYAWGLSVRTHRGLPIVSHGGNFPGWESKMVRFPTEHTTVIVLANREDLDVSAMAFRLADEALEGRIDPGSPHADDTFDGAHGAWR